MSLPYQKHHEPKTQSRSRSQSFPDYTENAERFKKTEVNPVRSKLESREAPDNSPSVRIV